MGRYPDGGQMMVTARQRAAMKDVVEGPAL
jgi:hypothetical protein